MEPPDLAALAGSVDPPPTGGPAPGGSAGAAASRLDELARWWAAVAPAAGGAGPVPAEVPPPARVAHRWPAGPVTVAPPRAELAAGRFDAPRDPADALAWGVAVADDLVDDGTDLVLLTVPDRPAATVLAAHLLGLDPVEALGWPAGAGLDDGPWTHAVARLRDDLRRLRSAGGLPQQALTALGSAALCAASGLLVRAAARRLPVLLDGEAAATCALLVSRVTRHARQWWQAAHASGSPLHDRLLAELRLEPLLRLGIRAEDGTGVRLALAVLEAAAADRQPGPGR